MSLSGKHQIIYADPAWTFDDKNKNGNRGAGCKYDLMSLSDMMQMPINQISDKNCVLFMWWVGAQPQEALDLTKAWGFTLKNMQAFTWVKLNKRWLTKLKREFNVGIEQLNEMPEADALHLLTSLTKMGLGHFTRAGTESCLVATKGRLPRIDGGVRELIFAPLREHSRKPDEVRNRIERLYGDVSRIELFARTRAPGWSTWGNQTDKFLHEAA